MLRTALLWAALIVALGAWPGLVARGGDKTPTPDKLIDLLGSDDFAKRESANRALEAIGLKALPTLRKAQKHPDAEVRRRIKPLLAKLEIAEALQPRRVTLGAAPQTLAAAVADLAKQTGYSLSVDDPNDNPQRFAVKDVPFWEAVERLGRPTGRCVSVAPFEPGIHLKRREVRSPHVVVRGAFRLEAVRFHEDRDIDFAEPGKDKEPGRRDHLLTLTVSVLAEPRLIILDTEPARLAVALDEDGKTLSSVPGAGKPTPDESPFSEISREDYQHQSQVRLRRSSAKAKTIKMLRGEIPVWVVVQPKPVVVSDKFLAAQGRKALVGNAPIEITRAEQADDGPCYVRISVPARNDALRRFWLRRVHLEDAQGHRFKANGRGYSDSRGTYEVNFSYRAQQDPKVGPPSKLIVEDWITTHELIPFEFKDVPLP